jgi:quercetin dioxygenase-like cupin family protein
VRLLVRVFLFLAAVAAVSAQAPATAPVPAGKASHHRVTFENAAFRILDVNIPPGQTTDDHQHEFDIATVSMSQQGTPTRAQTPGQAWTTRAPRPLGDAAVTEYTGKPGRHRIENTGTSAYQLFAVENLKKGGWSTAAPATGLATKTITESRAFRMYDVRLGRQPAQTSHTHAVPTLVILLSGAVLSDGPDAKAKEFAPAPVGLKQLTRPGEWLLVPAGDTHHVVRLSNADARVVEIELR